MLRAKFHNYITQERIIESEIYESPEIQTDNTPSYLQGCPVEGCRGLINSECVCEVCSCTICGECRVLLFNGLIHKCNPDDIATIKAMTGNTKACPNCSACIYKIDGCDQMWCVKCKTAFSWETNRIERGGIHNPHYFQWLREQGEVIPRTPGDTGGNPDEDCQELPEQNIIYRVIPQDLTDVCENVYDSFWNVPFGRLYTFAFTDPQIYIDSDERDSSQHLTNIRLKYIRGKLTEEKWEDMVFINMKYYRNRRIFQEICKALRMTLTDRLIAFYNEMKKLDESDKVVIANKYKQEFEVIREYFNKCILEESTYIDSREINVISPKWQQVQYSELKNSDL